MSIMRCDQCQRNVDTDFEEMIEVDWDLCISYCETCYMEIEDERVADNLLRMSPYPPDPR